MKEHPIPQDITNYRFHIVGSMTLKQFGEVLVGVIASFVVYQSNLIALIKWPLIVLFFGGGLLAAFVPIEERPLSHWIATFFGIIYKPTQFFWKRTQKIPEPFLYQGDQEKINTVKEVDLTPARRQRIKEFLNSTKTITPDPEDLTIYEQQQISTVMQLFSVGPQAADIVNPTNVQKPDLKVRVRSMRDEYEEPEVVTQEIKQEVQHLVPDVSAIPILPDPVSIADTTDQSKKDIFLRTEQVAQNIEIPEEKVISIAEKEDDEAEEIKVVKKLQQEPEKQVFIADQKAQSANQDSVATTAATFNTELPFPAKPTEPNKLVGMVLDANNNLISNAIVEISTEAGHVARAVKTNALGQFFVTTPLKAGKYTVVVQRDGYQFEPIQIELKNAAVDPLEIRSK